MIYIYIYSYTYLDIYIYIYPPSIWCFPVYTHQFFAPGWPSAPSCPPCRWTLPATCASPWHSRPGSASAGTTAGSQKKGWVCTGEMEVSPCFFVVEWKVHLVSWCFLVVKWELTWFLNGKMRENLVFSGEMVPNPQKMVVIYCVEWELMVIWRVYHAWPATSLHLNSHDGWI